MTDNVRNGRAAVENENEKQQIHIRNSLISRDKRKVAIPSIDPVVVGQRSQHGGAKK
jgi:hypothetical protein